MKKPLPAGACQEAKDWYEKFETEQQAWDSCDNPSWMLWLLRHVADAAAADADAYAYADADAYAYAAAYADAYAYADAAIRKVHPTAPNW